MSHWTTSGAHRLRAKQSRTFGGRMAVITNVKNASVIEPVGIPHGIPISEQPQRLRRRRTVIEGAPAKNNPIHHTYLQLPNSIKEEEMHSYTKYIHQHPGRVATQSPQAPTIPNFDGFHPPESVRGQGQTEVMFSVSKHKKDTRLEMSHLEKEIEIRERLIRERDFLESVMMGSPPHPKFLSAFHELDYRQSRYPLVSEPPDGTNDRKKDRMMHVPLAEERIGCVRSLSLPQCASSLKRDRLPEDCIGRNLDKEKSPGISRFQPISKKKNICHEPQNDNGDRNQSPIRFFNNGVEVDEMGTLTGSRDSPKIDTDKNTPPTLPPTQRPPLFRNRNTVNEIKVQSSKSKSHISRSKKRMKNAPPTGNNLEQLQENQRQVWNQFVKTDNPTNSSPSTTIPIITRPNKIGDPHNCVMGEIFGRCHTQTQKEGKEIDAARALLDFGCGGRTRGGGL